MQAVNLMDLNIDHGDLVTAAEVTGRRDEILAAVEAELREVHGELILARRDEDEFLVGVLESNVEMFTSVRNQLTQTQ